MIDEFRDLKRQKTSEEGDGQPPPQPEDKNDEEREIEEMLRKLDTRNGLIEVLKVPDTVYNPSMPNDFELILARRQKKKKDLEKQLKHVKKMKKMKKEEERRMQEPVQVNLDVSGEEAFMMRASKTKKLTGKEKAKQMMEKMGWGGKGLGIDEQGITTPLIHQKTSKSTGKIVPGASYQNQNK